MTECARDQVVGWMDGSLSIYQKHIKISNELIKSVAERWYAFCHALENRLFTPLVTEVHAYLCIFR